MKGFPLPGHRGEAREKGASVQRGRIKRVNIGERRQAQIPVFFPLFQLHQPPFRYNTHTHTHTHMYQSAYGSAFCLLSLCRIGLVFGLSSFSLFSFWNQSHTLESLSLLPHTTLSFFTYTTNYYYAQNIMSLFFVLSRHHCITVRDGGRQCVVRSLRWTKKDGLGHTYMAASNDLYNISCSVVFLL